MRAEPSERRDQGAFRATGAAHDHQRYLPRFAPIVLSDLVPSAVVKIMSGPAVIRQFEASEPTREVDLSNATLTPGQMLTVVQGLCNVFGPPSPVPAVVTQPAQHVAPNFGAALYLRACRAGGGRRGGVLCRNLFGEAQGRIGHATAFDSEVDVAVAPKLEPPDPGGHRERITAVVHGCASGNCDGKVEPPVDTPPFEIVVPLDGDRSVLVRNLVPDRSSKSWSTATSAVKPQRAIARCAPCRFGRCCGKGSR